MADLIALTERILGKFEVDPILWTTFETAFSDIVDRPRVSVMGSPQECLKRCELF